MGAEGEIWRRVEAAAGRLPRWQRGRDWTAARAPRCPDAPPRRSSPPTSSEGAAAVREPGAARSAGSGRRAEEAAALARRPPPPLRTGPRRRAAGHGPAQGPPGGLGPQPVARYVPLLTPTLASGSPSLTHRGLGSGGQEPVAVRSQGPTSAAFGDVGPPGSGCRQAARQVLHRREARRGGLDRGLWCVWEELKRLELKSAEGRWPLRALCFSPRAPPSFPHRHGGHSGSRQRRGSRRQHP